MKTPTEDRELRLGFIGAGRHARANLYPSLAALGQPLAAICTRSIETADSAARTFGASRAFSNVSQMLSETELDAVIVSIEGKNQAPMVCSLLEKGVHVFVEKPLGWTAKEASDVAVLSESTNNHVMVGFMKRFAPAYLRTKEMLADSRFGRTLSATSMFAVRSFGPDIELFLKYGAIHYVDLARYFFGEIATIDGYRGCSDGATFLTFVFKSESGVVGTMYLGGVNAWSRHYEEFVVTGASGFVMAENLRKVVVHFEEPTHPGSNAPRWTRLDESEQVITSIDTSSAGGLQSLYLNGYVGELEHFLTSIRAGQSPMCSARDNVKTMQLCERLLEGLHPIA